TPDSAPVKAIVGLVGGKVEDVPRVLGLYHFPTLAEQASGTWLGGAENSGAAKALRDTAKFLMEQKKIPALAADYSRFVTSEYVEAVLRAQSE
ncbi:MAG: taurine ABC transporter substrate-binding protein, partial [Acidobacteriota bacterium]